MFAPIRRAFFLFVRSHRYDKTEAFFLPCTASSNVNQQKFLLLLHCDVTQGFNFFKELMQTFLSRKGMEKTRKYYDWNNFCGKGKALNGLCGKTALNAHSMLFYGSILKISSKSFFAPRCQDIFHCRRFNGNINLSPMLVLCSLLLDQLYGAIFHELSLTYVLWHECFCRAFLWADKNRDKMNLNSNAPTQFWMWNVPSARIEKCASRVRIVCDFKIGRNNIFWHPMPE